MPEESLEDICLAKENDEPPKTGLVAGLVKFFDRKSVDGRPPIDTIEV